MLCQLGGHVSAQSRNARFAENRNEAFRAYSSPLALANRGNRRCGAV